MAAYLIALHMGLHASNKRSEPESLLSVLESVQPVRLLLEKREDYDRQSEDREVSAAAGVVFRPCADAGFPPVVVRPALGQVAEAMRDARRSTGKFGAPARGR